MILARIYLSFEKTMKNIERLGQQAWPGIDSEPPVNQLWKYNRWATGANCYKLE